MEYGMCLEHEAYRWSMACALNMRPVDGVWHVPFALRKNDPSP